MPAKALPLNADQELKLQAWRSNALERMPYMATMLFSVRVLNAPGLGTFAVDPFHRMYIDFDAVEEKGPGWCSETLLHECGHLFGDHHHRGIDMGVTPAEQRTANIASDAEINDDLRDAGCDMSDAVLPERIGCDDYQTFEHYLTELRKNQPNKPDNNDGGHGQTGNDDDGEGGGQQPFEGCGSGSGGEAAPCELDPTNTLGGAAEPANDIEREVAALSTAEAIRQHEAKNPGSVPAGLVDRANLLVAPTKTPWRKILASRVKRCVATRLGQHDVTFTRRSRRHHDNPIFMPARISPIPNLVVVRDTSGSMSNDDLNEATSEIESIARQIGIRGRELLVADTDVEVANVTGYKGAASVAEIHGRGGTDMRAGIEAAEEMRPRPAAIIVLTDGFTPWPETQGRTPVVAVMIGNPPDYVAQQVPEWIHVVHANDDD